MLDGSGEDEPVHIRGNHKNRSPKLVPRAILTALRDMEPAPILHGSGRLELARQLVDPTNPLVARVIVNRLWHHLFGRGIVPTVDDFGVLDERPSHRVCWTTWLTTSSRTTGRSSGRSADWR